MPPLTLPSPRLCRVLAFGLLFAATARADDSPSDEIIVTAAACWGTDWAAAGYDDEGAFVESCDTRAWEMRKLEADAGHDGATDAVCASRAEAFNAPDATCDTYTNIDWSAPAWESP